MAYTYRFVFYHPSRGATPHEVGLALRGLIGHGAQVVDYERGFQRRPVAPGAGPDLATLVEPAGRSGVGLAVSRPFGPVDIYFQTFPPEGKGAIASLTIDEEYFDRDASGSAELLLDLSRVINLHLPVLFAWGDHELALAQLEHKLTFDRVAALAWANLFSPELASRLGEARLKTAPAHQIIAFKRGILYLLSPAPTIPPSTKLVSQISAHFPGCLVTGL